MSSRVLRKLQSEKEKDLVENDNISDIEIDTPVGGARKKQLNMNRYDLVRLLYIIALCNNNHFKT